MGFNYYKQESRSSFHMVSLGFRQANYNQQEARRRFLNLGHMG